ncbi:phospholipase A(1) DAD1, chloroplastic-like [Cynara cardunculus var. scolymus]|uniref:phospholipase A(1) DAD1, chloroplastic-like n=1 Tax=Cynara cardunculus var. scolymus TaxID=59895 RepID=UPI000D623CDA|nr:phospholipase A(1) DAD1, chloroplastic-like [Cynara cardunculus var. scolymus]
MRLCTKWIQPFSPTANPPLEPACRWRCAVSMKTAQQTRGTRASSKWERLVIDSGEGCQPRSLSQLDKRWMEYHGSKNWEGLLDPLDDGLRGEIIRYGSFVEAAYQCFDSDPSSPSYGTCRYTKNSSLERAGVHGSGYRVTKNLHATSSIPMPHWTGQIGVRSSWIGFVAVCEDQNEISRLGRRDVVISLRGTGTCLEWLENLRATLTRCPFGNENNMKGQNDEPMVESGVLSLYTSSTSVCPSLQQSIADEILRIVQKYSNEPLSVTITGHSLGASLAILAAYDIKTTIKHALHLSVISFGGPRVGNRSFRHNLELQGTKILRIVNSDDLITKVPGFFVEDHDDMAQEQKARGPHLHRWIRKHVNDNQWVYANIGHELRLSSRASLQLNSINVATCHDLKTYLHLVNGFVSSTCPFRASARMMLNKATAIPPTQ